ncbi:MAG: hypothetical protein J5825_05615 [Lachnospiraceae bacterium]|nr:hypothetical protein [Lachnospiraceae bacterium]
MDRSKQELKAFYEERMYGIWRDGEEVSYELMGPDPMGAPDAPKPKNPFAIIGGDLVRVNVTKDGKKASFVIHAYIPEDDARKAFEEKHKACDRYQGLPFVICMHPIFPKDHLLEQGIAVLVLDILTVASDDIRHQGAFYELYPYTEEPSSQTGALMAWAWGASKVLDAVYAGLNKEYGLDAEASMVTGVSRFGKATAVCGAFDDRFKLTVPACSGAGGLALYGYFSEGKTYDLSSVGGDARYTYSQNEPLSCLQSEGERGWFNDRFLEFTGPESFPVDQEGLPIMAMDPDRFYFVIAAYTGEDWVNAPSMWECFKRAEEVYRANGLSDHLVLHFHLVGHAVLDEDTDLILPYFDRMYYGLDTFPDLGVLKTTAFAGQENGI